MPTKSETPSRPPHKKSQHGSSSQHTQTVIGTINNINHVPKPPRRISDASYWPKNSHSTTGDVVGANPNFPYPGEKYKLKNGKTIEKETSQQTAKTNTNSITPFSYNEQEVTKGYQGTSFDPVAEVQQLAPSETNETLKSSYTAKLKHSLLSVNVQIVPGLTFHKSSNRIIDPEFLAPGQKSRDTARMEQYRTAIAQLWQRRRNVFNFISTNVDKAYSRLTADALAMATIQLKMPRKDIWRALVAELIGTCLLIILGCGSILRLSNPKELDLTGIGLCWGFTVATLAQTLGHVSGCHMNPAVTLAMMVTGKLQLIKAGLYIVAQCGGGMMGAAILKALTPDEIQGNWGITTLAPGITPLQGFGIEFVATFVLLMVILGATDENRDDVKGSVPLAVGLCVTALVYFCGPFTGASMNPARSLGPAVVASHWESHWVYWLGPISGAITAATLYSQIFRALSPGEVATIQAEDDIKKRESDTKEGNIPNV